MTHTKCGGTIRRIPDPPWFTEAKKAEHYPFPRSEFGACERCGLSGELVDVSK